MNDQEVYEEYVTDQEWYAQYSAYQKKYEDNPRESDLEILRLVQQCLFAAGKTDADASILDMGCSTGNLLRLIRKHLPAATLTGMDYMAPVVEECRNAPDLANIDFDMANLLDWQSTAKFDIIMINAVTFLFNDSSHHTALENCYRALKPGGSVIGFEYIYPGDYQDAFTEISDGHPNGLVLHCRAEKTLRDQGRDIGFSDIQVRPFDIPVDLPKPEKTGTDLDLVSYTKQDPLTQRRLLFRGDRYQPWAHYVLSKAGEA